MKSSKLNNPAFTYVSEINQICKSLFKRLNLNAFSYSKILEDGSRSELWSDANALEHSFFIKKHIKNVYTRDLFNGQKHVLYDFALKDFPLGTQNKIQEQLKDQREIFDHDNCLFLINYHEKYTEYFAFYTSKSDYSAPNKYLNNLEILNNFCRYFRSRAKLIIHEAERNKLIDPWRDFSEENGIENNLIYAPHITPIIGKESVKLTEREREVGILLCEGRTAKESAEILCVTSKTIEKHIENIKEKFHCNRRIQLVNLLNAYNEQ